KTPPTITGAASPAANAAGWNNTDVTVSFVCSDTLSGVASCAGPTTLSSDGAAQSVTGTASDNAGNTASATVTGINIDKTPPTITATATTADGASYPSGSWTRQTVTVHFACADAGGSGLAGACPADVSKGADGSYDVFATVSDVAGNSASS